MSDATPRPWRAGRPDMATIVDGYDAKWIYSDGKYIAAVSSMDVEDWGTVLANAALIVRAVNAHEALVEALKAVQRLDYFREHNALARQVAEALRAAEGDA